MKKITFVLALFFVFLCGCSKSADTASSLTVGSEYDAFAQKENGNLVSGAGTEYSLLAMEYDLCYLGEEEFFAYVMGEEKFSEHLGLSYKCGLYSLKGDKENNVLIRKFSDNEWYGIYRKVSLPEFDISIDNCSRLEFILNNDDTAAHKKCTGGMVDAEDITAFIAEIKQQKSAEDAGYFDLVLKPDGSLHNCYLYGSVYAFFDEEPNVAMKFDVTSYNDLAYSVLNGDTECVLSEEWIKMLQQNH